jgi:tetratricopeptide (TPR) repeat protein
MPLRNFILLLIWVLSFSLKPGQVFSQTKQIDSLKLLLVNAKEDTNKVNTLNRLSNALYMCDDLDNCLQFAQQQLSLTKKIGYQSGEAYAFLNIANCNVDNNKLEEAYAYYKLANQLGQKINNKRIIGISYANFGNVESLRGNYIKATTKFDTALIYYREIGDKEHIAHTMANMAMNYYDQNNYSEAITHFYTAISYWEKFGNKPMLANCHTYVGDIKVEQKNYCDALNEYKKALDINISRSTETNESSVFNGYEAMSLSKIGEVYLLLKKPDSAILKFKNALEKLIRTKFTAFLTGGKSRCYTGIGQIYELWGDSAKQKGENKKAKDNFLIAHTNYEKSLKQYIEEGYGKRNYENDVPTLYIHLGNINIKLNNYLQGGIWLKQALALSTKKRARPQLRDSYLNLSKFYEITGNSSEAYENYKKYVLYRDSIVNEESLRKTEGYKMQYEFDKKEDSLKQVQIITETKLKAEKKQKYFYWVGLSLLALLSFFVFLNFRNQKKINRLAAEAYANERTELELQSLRAQLNPHFIFNCINSIDAFIHSNDKYNATIYLNKFARLLRNILDSSKLSTVSFAKDIDTLKLYVELEELRHENKFKTEFNIDDELLSNDYKVPALIIQPFVENAILHGLKNREDNEGLLQIEIKKVADKIEYSIKDNGIGRKAAGMIAQNKEASYGMQMSNDRIKLFNKEEKPSVQIIDLYKDDIATGTEVKVSLNLI